MSRYINIENFCENFCHCNNEYCDKLSCPILNAPTADVAEVKHGEWKLCYEDWRKQIAGDECSVCGSQHFGVSISHYPYCPNCGARMDGGDFDEMPNNKSQE